MSASENQSKSLNADFVRLLEALANGVVIADQAGTIVYSNPFLEGIFGYGAGELAGKSVEMLMPAELRHLHARHRAHYNSSPETRLMGAGRDLLARRKDGSVFPVEVGLSPITTPDGVRVVAIVTDISKRKHAEQRSLLQKDIALILAKADTIQNVALKLLETVGTTLGWSVGAFWLVDEDRQVLRNAAFWQTAGARLTDFEIVSRTSSFHKGECSLGHVWETGSPEWIRELSAMGAFTRSKEAAAAGLQSLFELPILVAGRTAGIMEFFSHDTRPPDQEIIDIAVAVASQIGQLLERKRSERALGIVEERYRSLFENAVFGIIRSAASGEILDANPALVAMLGYENVEEVLRLNCNEDLYKDPRNRQMLIDNSAISDRFEEFETEWKTKAGGTIQVRLSGRTVRADDGSLAGFEAIVEDITQRKSLEQQFRQAQKMEAIGRLAGGVAHDFNNLLTIVAVSTDTLLDLAGSNEPVRQTVDEIARATEQGASLVRQLMAFSRTQPQVPEPVDLNEVINSSRRMLQILAGEDIRFEFNLHRDECLVAVEHSKLEQILMNLVANSRDAMPSGGAITITTSVMNIAGEETSSYVGLKPAKHVKLHIADTGHGMPPDVQAHIFEPFFSTKEEGRGSGLGLSTVYGIVRQHQGHISCKSAVGAGAAFTVILPAAEQRPVTVERSHAPQKVRRGSEKILLVDDEPSLRASVRRILEQSGYSVVVAANGAEALQAINDDENGFDLLVTDIALPQMRGTELAERLLRIHPELRVLYMSGYNEESVLPSDAHFIPKPFRREGLIRRIREILDA